jgi:integrase
MHGSFVKKRGNTWSAYFYVSGGEGERRQRSKGGFATKGDAQDYLQKTMHTVHTGEYVEPARLTLAEYLLDRWLPTIETSIRPSTFDSYTRQLKLHVLPHLGRVQLQQISVDDLDRLYAELLKRGRTDGKGGLSPKTIHYVHTTLHKALRDAVRKQLLGRNVADAAGPPRTRQTGERELQTWNPEQIRTFLAALRGHRLEVAYLLAVTTGMRRGEVLGLCWRDIDFKQGRLTVRQTLGLVNYKLSFGSPKTVRSRRTISLDPATLAALSNHRTRQRVEKATNSAIYHDQDLVFAKADGSPTNPDYYSQCFDRTVAKLPVPRIRLHDLRHTHATLGLQAGVPAKIMSERLGHASVGFTLDVYTHVIPGHDQDAANQVAGLILDVQEEASDGSA